MPSLVQSASEWRTMTRHSRPSVCTDISCWGVDVPALPVPAALPVPVPVPSLEMLRTPLLPWAVLEMSLTMRTKTSVLSRSQS